MRKPCRKARCVLRLPRRPGDADWVPWWHIDEQVFKTGRDAVSLATDTSVHVEAGTDVVHSLLRHTTVGRDCRIINSVLEGHPEWPVTIGDHVTLINCHVRSTGERNHFAFCGWEVDQRSTHLEDGVAFSNSR